MLATIPLDDEYPNNALLKSAKLGFDHLFSNDILEAKRTFACSDDPFHLLGLGVCAFLEAALGMESGLMTEAAKCLSLSEAGARKKLKSGNGGKTEVASRFPAGLEWEILLADAVVMLGLTHALSESYMGYLQCMYSLNNAHSKFTKLYKTVFPHGLDAYATPASTPRSTPGPTRKSSSPSIRSRFEFSLSTSPSMSSISNGAPPNPMSPPNTNTNAKSRPSFFERWTGGQTLTVPVYSPGHSGVDVANNGIAEASPVDELIVAGTAFGYGLFNLVFSLLPQKVQSLVGFFGFKHDRRLALQALAISAQGQDVHSIFSGLVLMTYYGVVLLLSGYQADEVHIIKQYKSIVDNIATRYPQGALWILNRAKILRMTHDAEGAILVLREGLRPERPHSFAQADTLLVFELAWTLLGQRRYQEAADMFLRLTELNSWSHGTYYFLAAGCYISLGNLTKAQELLNIIPDLISKKKISGKDLPTEVLIKKKLEFYKEKQRRRGGDEKLYAQVIKISLAEELCIFWNTHAHVDKSIAQAHIEEWSALTPSLPRMSSTASASNNSKTPVPTSGKNTLDDLDTEDELALRSLLLGISFRTAGDFASSRACLKDAYVRQSAIRVSTWIPGVAMFEMAVLDLKVVEARENRAAVAEETGDAMKANLAANVPEDEEGENVMGRAGGWKSTGKDEWERALASASEKLDMVLSLATSTVDLSSRLDSRVAMLRDEIATKIEMLGMI